MNERIDHAKQSRAVLNALIGAHLPSSEVAPLVAIAQVHPTLALVEQQRIANLLALHRHEVKHDIGAWSRLYEHGTDDLKPGIKHALGLT